MNINDIAKMAGVSRAAVSRYLNNGYISEEKKDRIRKVIEETGYRPSSQAQMLRTKKTKMIGVIIPKINSQSISRMVAGISDIADANDYQLLLANTKNNTDEEIKYLEVFRENHVDGIIFFSTVITNKLKAVLKKCDMPMVILGQKLHGYSCVYQNDYDTARDIAKVLVKDGNCFGFIGVLEGDQAVGYSRKKGFEDVIRESGIDQDKVVMGQADFTIESGYETMKELYEKMPEIDAVMCVTEGIAIGALIYLKEIGKRVPQDVNLVGMGDSPIAKVFDPKFPTVHFHYKSSGIEAAKILLEQMDDPHTVKKELCMSYEIVENV